MEREDGEMEGGGGEGGDYSKEAIILNISIKEGWGEAIIRGR